MRTSLIVLLLLFALKSNSQFLHKADSLFYNYSKTVKKRKPDAHVVLQRGRLDYINNEPGTYLTKVDSLKITSLAVINKKVELAVFDDFSSPKITILDSCSLFQMIDAMQGSLMPMKEYLKTQANINRSKPSNLKSYEFETLTIKLKSTSYGYRIADKTRDFYGNNLVSTADFVASRKIIDAIYALVNIR